MTEIVLPADLAAEVASAIGPIHLVDPQGRLVGIVSMPSNQVNGFTEEEITEARKRAQSAGPWHSTEQLLERLHGLGKP